MIKKISRPRTCVLKNMRPRTCVDEELGALVPMEMKSMVNWKPSLVVRLVQDVRHVILAPPGPRILFVQRPEEIRELGVAVLRDEFHDFGGLSSASRVALFLGGFVGLEQSSRRPCGMRGQHDIDGRETRSLLWLSKTRTLGSYCVRCTRTIAYQRIASEEKSIANQYKLTRFNIILIWPLYPPTLPSQLMCCTRMVLTQKAGNWNRVAPQCCVCSAFFDSIYRQVV